MSHCIAKLCGADTELGNFILGVERERGTGRAASRILLREIAGLPIPSRSPSSCYCPTCRSQDRWQRSEQWGAARYGTDGGEYGGAQSGYSSQDWGRKFLRENGGCCYIDLDHLEVALPEVISAYDHVAAWHAMLRIVHAALQSANAQMPNGHKIVVLVNNSDGQGNSYGSHIDLLVTRRGWENIFERRMQYLLYLAAYQSSSIVFTGQGKVGAENRAPEVHYQIAQRADFFETLTGTQTTYRRPIVNSRDEALCGHSRSPENEEMARLHVIFYDNTLCHGASLLKVGVLQILLAMIEAGQMNPALILDDPLDALIAWSHDPTLQTRCRLASGDRLTAVELQLLFLEEARRFVDADGCAGVVPQAPDILNLWADTLTKLKAGDLNGLVGRVDWILKMFILERAMHQRPALTWDSPEIKHIDHQYSSLEDGLFWVYARSGLVEQYVTDAAIDRFVREPPQDTRAWTRAMLLRTADPETVDHVDWDAVTFKLQGKRFWPTYGTVHLSNPLGFTKARTEAVFRLSDSLDKVLDILGDPAIQQSARSEPLALASGDGASRGENHHQEGGKSNE